MKKKLPKIYLFLLFGIIASFNTYAQQEIILSGTVLDAQTLTPLPGVTILEKGTNNGTATDFDGNYSLTVNTNATIVASFIGFTTLEIPVDGRTTIDINLLPDDEQLSEVVVVAYGTQKKETVTGSISSIDTEELTQSPAANLAVTLAGRLPGLTALQRSGEPGNDLTQIFIRGQGTINAQSPIVLVDGVERDLNYIDPNEVESVTILKDASSTAIFGVRGANGVILVTTKRGTSEVPEISFSAETGAQAFTRLADPVNAFQFATLRNLAQTNDGLEPAYSQEVLDAYRTGSDPVTYPNTDWVDLLVKDWSLQQRYNLNISGAGKAVSYFVNAGFLNQGGQFNVEDNLNYDPTFKLDRYNFRSNIDIKINKGLSAFLNLAGYVEKQNGPFAVGVASTGQGGASPSQFILANVFDIPSNVPGPLTPDNAVVTSPTQQNPPFGILNRTGYRQQTRSNITATFGMQQDLDFLTDGLSAKAVISFDSRAINNLNASKTYRRKVQVIERTETGQDSVYFRNFGDDVESPLNISGSQGFRSFSDFKGYLNYDRNFDKVHDVSALLLYQQQKEIINQQLPYNLRGIATRLTYGYKSKYFVEFNAGYNGSEQFAKGNRFGFFPAYSAGWIISREKFWENVNHIHFLKVRGSYGEVGNDRIGNDRFLYLDDINVVGGGYSPSLGLGQRIIISQLKNENLQWEVARKTNIGLEVGFLEDFDLAVDLFYEKRDNILRNRGTIPILNGLPIGTLPPVNIGVVENKGYEVELNYRKAFNKDFSFLSRVFVSYATNVQEFADEPFLPEDYAYRYRQQGYRIGQGFGYIVEKYFESQQEIDDSPQQVVGGHESRPGDFKYKDLNDDGVVNERDIAPIGFSNVPEYTFGAAFNATYKNFDLSILIQGVDNVTNFYQSRGTFAGDNYFGRHLESWTQERFENGDPINYPRLTIQPSPNEIANSFFIIDASYVRLKNVELGYVLPENLSDKIGAKRVRIYTNGLNIITWDNLPTDDFDPELTGPLAYPVTKLYNFGLNVSF